MTIQPEFWPLVLLSTTLATTPSPRMISSIVPRTSARNGVMRRRKYQRCGAVSTLKTERRPLGRERRPLCCVPRWLELDDVLRRRALLTLHDFELDALAFSQ